MESPSLRTGDREEDIERVVDTYGAMVYRLAVAQVHTAPDADDVFQEVFLRYIRKAPAFESEEHRKAWLIRVTINCARKFWRSAWRRHTVPLEEDIPFEQPEDRGLFEALHTLPGPYAAVLHLFYCEDLPVADIARLLNRRPSTVRSQLTRGRALLRRELEKEEGAPREKGETVHGTSAV